MGLQLFHIGKLGFPAFDIPATKDVDCPLGLQSTANKALSRYQELLPNCERDAPAVAMTHPMGPIDPFMCSALW